MPLCLKRKTFNQSVLQAIFYGAETRTLTKPMKHRIQITQQSMERFVQGIIRRYRKRITWKRNQTKFMTSPKGLNGWNGNELSTLQEDKAIKTLYSDIPEMSKFYQEPRFYQGSTKNLHPTVDRKRLLMMLLLRMESYQW